MRYSVGDKIDPLVWQAADARAVRIPSPEAGLTLLQFSRWAGCPICNLHLASFKHRAAELDRAGIAVVIVFHSLASDVIELRGDLPFALIADPDKKLYRAFGVGSSPFFLLHPKAFCAFRAEAKRGNRARRVHGGVRGLPADFLIDPTGAMVAVHYGSHADDSLGVDYVLSLAKRE